MSPLTDHDVLRILGLACAFAVGLIGLRAHNLIDWPWVIVLAPIGMLALSGLSAVVLLVMLERKARR